MDTNDHEEEEKVVFSSNKKPVVHVEYCIKCGLPYEYCELDEKCNPKIKDKKQPVSVPVEEKKENSKTEEKEEKKIEEKIETKEEKPKKKVVIKDKEDKIILTKTSRNKKKYICAVQGLDKFNINIKDAAKKMGKKFACGASAISDDTVEIQGDILEELSEFLLKEYPHIRESQIVIKEKKVEK